MADDKWSYFKKSKAKIMDINKVLKKLNHSREKYDISAKGFYEIGRNRLGKIEEVKARCFEEAISLIEGELENHSILSGIISESEANGVCPHCGSDDFHTYSIITDIIRVSCCHRELRTYER